ncbi:hypothetical protein CYY_007836 [Polysphondylium violaceum]|uniref:EGF-like domain-containing protein n=1 Tax=Polysphondylium violaceum TaxID=133409 RepID=A0A8J4PQA0_9MYCE|nr:hypothetical protein CYY_007836 [Polysphondylium violaceum]
MKKVIDVFFVKVLLIVSLFTLITEDKNISFFVNSRVGATVNSCFFSIHLKIDSSFPFKNITGSSGVPTSVYYGDWILLTAYSIANVNQSPRINIYDKQEILYPIDFPEYVCVGPPLSTNLSNFIPRLVIYKNRIPEDMFSIAATSDTTEFSISQASSSFIFFESTLVLGTRTKLFFVRIKYSDLAASSVYLSLASGDLYRSLIVATPFVSLSGKETQLVSFTDHNSTNSFLVNILDPSGEAQIFAICNLLSTNYTGFIHPVYGNPNNATYIGYKSFNNPSTLVISASVVSVGIGKPTLLKTLLYNTPTHAIGGADNIKTYYKEGSGALTFSSFITKTFDSYVVGDEVRYDPFSDYPFGFSDGNYNNITFTKSFFLPTYYPQAIIIFGTTRKDSMAFAPSSDKIAPSVNKLEYIQLSNGKLLTRLNATIGPSGFKEFTISNAMISYTLFSKDLVFNNPLYAIYEKMLPPSRFTLMLKLMNNVRTSITLPSDNPFIPKAKSILFQDLTSFSFDLNNVDLSNNGVWNIVSLNVTNADITQIIPFKLICSDLLATQYKTNEMEWDYLSWDVDKKLYTCNFFMPARMFTGYVHYIINIEGQDVGPSTLSSLFANASLYVSSSDADEMAPIVGSITTLRGELLPNNTQTIGWRFTILDPLNGLESGNLTINSDVDYLGYQFTFGPCDSVDPYKGVYDFNITIDLNICKTQIFSIKELTLRDTSGHFSNSTPSYRSSYYVTNPFINHPDLSLFNIPISCQNLGDNEGPLIFNFKTYLNTIDVTSKNRTMQVYFETSDINGISIRHNPYIYIEDLSLKPTGFKATRVKGYTNTWVSYNTTIEIPYNFALTEKKFGISIYGVADKLMNIKGMSFDQLKNQSGNSIINVKTDDQDVIITNVQRVGTKIFIYGHNFGLDPNMISIKIIVPNTIVTYNRPDFIEFSSIYILIKQFVQLDEFTIQIDKNENNGIKSDSYYFTPPSSKVNQPVYCTGFPPDNEVDPYGQPTDQPITSPPTQKCPKGCGESNNYGYCNNGACFCFYPHSGIDCSSTIVNTTITTPNTTDPTVIVNTIDQQKFESVLSVVALRELKTDSSQIKLYDFVPGNWILISSASNDIYKRYEYVYMLESTNITSIVQIFSQSYNVTFGNQVINIQPSTVKFTFNITSYQFESSLNTLQLVLMASFKSSSSLGSTCSLTDFIDDSSSEYLRIQIQDRSLYGRFIKYAIVEGRETLITNTLLKDYKQSISKPDESQSYIGLNIPYYKNNVQLDPDFSVLIENKSANDHENSICTIKQNKLTGAQIAGIVIGGVVFLVIISAALIFFFSRKGSSPLAIKLKKVISN